MQITVNDEDATILSNKTPQWTKEKYSIDSNIE